MSRYPPPTPQSQYDSQSIGLSSYQRSETRPTASSRSQQASQPTNYPNPSPGSASGSSSDPEQSRRTARIHYDELNQWLYQGSTGNSKNSQNRSNPRDKLTRLTRQQFQELSTDVYDELCRRIERGEQDGGEGKGGSPFLLSRDDFHPKRNQARQKLATLPRSRFRDLASDVFYELERRYPEFAEPEVISSRQNYSNPQPSKPFPPDPRKNNSPPINNSQSQSSLSNPSLRPLLASNGGGGGGGGGGGMLANDVIVPDKSTLVVDASETLAYDDGSSTGPAPTKSSVKSSVASFDRDREFERDMSSETERTDYFDRGLGNSSKRGSGSLSSLKYISNKNSSASDSRSPAKARTPSVKSTHDYERRISLMQTKIKNLEQELIQTQRQTELRAEDTSRIHDLEEQLTTWKERYARQRDELKELDNTLESERTANARDMKLAKEDINRLNRQIAEMEREQARPAATSSSGSSAMVERMKAEVTDLLQELRRLQDKQDELIAEREADQDTIRELEEDVLFNKKRYEAAKTELRNLKRTSALHAVKNFLPQERLPITETGAIADIHFTAFTLSIDELLQAGRTNGNDDVINAMRTVIAAVGAIDEDVQQFEANSSVRNPMPMEDRDRLEGIKARINATLSNLITATKNHVVSLGLSPISLLDAASSHLSFSMIELVKLVGMRKADALEIERYENRHSNGRQYDDEDDGGPVLASQMQFTHRNTNGNGSISANSNSGSSLMKGDKGRKKEEIRVSPNKPPVPLPVKALGIRLDESRYPLPSSLRRPTTPPRSPMSDSRDLQSSFEKKQSAPQLRNQSASITRGTNKYDDMRSPTAFDGSNESDLRDSASGSSTTNPDKVFDSPPRRGAENSTPGLVGKVMGNGPRGPGGYQSASIRKIGNFGLGISRAEDEEREKLKAYLETQTESIVAYIQALLSAIRGGAQGSRALSENLTQIITIVSSIVAMTGDSLPPKPETERILSELSENCNRLSEMQDVGAGTNGAGFTKQTKQAMAAASFGVAKALKELNSYIAGDDVSVL